MSHFNYFVDAGWLKDHLYDDDVFVIDCRFDLFDPAEYGESAYVKSHIDGAYYLDIDRDLTEDKGEHGGKRGVPDPDILAEKLADIGISLGSDDADSTIVCYDDGVYSAPRAWWQLRYMGFDKVYVLDGGFRAWCNAGCTVSADKSTPREGGTVNWHLRTDMFADKDAVESASSDPSAIIVDSRAMERYTGEVEPLYSKPGHIPGAVNVHYLLNMKRIDDKEEAADVTYGMVGNDRYSLDYVGDPVQWRENFAECLDRDNIILYCGSAIEAAINYMFLTEVGHEPRLYVGSMSDWVTYDELPVESGS